MYTENAEDFFMYDGNDRMHLSLSAAFAVCDRLTAQETYVRWIDCGIWKNGRYEERVEFGILRSDKLKHMSIKKFNEYAKSIMTEIIEESNEINCFTISYEK